MGKIIKLYNTWEKAKDIFVKPSLKVYFGKWRNDPNLPVWRNGPCIWLIPMKYRSTNGSKVHTVKDSVMICTGEVPYKFGDVEFKSKCYKWVPKHKLPGNLKCGQYVWNRNIRKKLKKWHLSWIPPVIYLPIWMRFHIINSDLMWKTKWDTYRYEFPPQFTIIGFGLSLSLTLHAPIHNKYACDDHYWEAILNQLYKNKSGNLKETIEETGIWRILVSKDKDEDIHYFSVRPEYIVHNKLEEYYVAISEIKAKQNKVIL